MSVLEAHAYFAEQSVSSEREAFTLADDLLTCARGMLSGPINRSDERGILLSLLLGRVVHAATGCVLMIRAGLPVQSDTLLRSAMEAGFRLAAIARDPAAVHQYIAESPAIRLRAMQDLRNHIDSGGPADAAITREMLDAVLADVEAERSQILEQRGVKCTNTHDVFSWAKAADQLDLFRLLYVLKSQAAHHSVRDLERHMVRDANNGLGSLCFVPQLEGSAAVAIADVMTVLGHAVDAYASAMAADATAFSDRYQAVRAIIARAAGETAYA